MNNITLHICRDECTAVTFDTIMTNNSWQQKELITTTAFELHFGIYR